MIDLSKAKNDTNDQNICYDNNSIRGYYLIKKYFRVELYFITYQYWSEVFYGFVLLIWWKISNEINDQKKLCYDKNSIRGFYLIKKCFRVKTYFISYLTRFYVFPGFVWSMQRIINNDSNEQKKSYKKNYIIGLDFIKKYCRVKLYIIPYLFTLLINIITSIAQEIYPSLFTRSNVWTVSFIE